MIYNILYTKIGGAKDLSAPYPLDLTKIKPDLSLENLKEGIEVMTTLNNKFGPMFENPLQAKELSLSSSIHLVVPGILPVLPESWKEFRKNKIFYMPNDFVPHFHGTASHHMGEGFKLDRAFSLLKDDFNKTDKRLAKFRDNLNDFNNGESNTAIETWIEWKIPSNNVPYKDLIVKKNSIIWWDFTDHHNLNLIRSKARYDNNEFDNNIDTKITDNINKDKNIVVTLMDKKGTYYFLCSIPGHAEMGHKITIKVID